MRKQKPSLPLFQPSINKFFNVSQAFRVSTFTMKVVSIHAMKGYRERRGKAQLIFNLSSDHPWKEPGYPHIRRLGVPQSRS
jgi:hypothetical protein